jgi:hypothetical protein
MTIGRETPLEMSFARQSSKNGTEKRKKRAAVAGGSKFKQGGVKQSGQEPLNVQKMDNQSNDRESLTTR